MRLPLDARTSPWLGLILLAALLGPLGCHSSKDSADDGSADETPDTADASVQPDELILYAPSSFTTTYLVGSDNQPVYEWQSEYKAGQSAFLLDDGGLVTATARWSR